MVSNSKNYVDYDNGRIYHYPEIANKNYAQAQAACAALTYTGFTGTGSLIILNRWGACAGPGLLRRAPGPAAATWLVADPGD
jgi:hypothetical protein